MKKTSESVLKDIQEHPDNHRHTCDELITCCSIDGAISFYLMDAHALYVDLGTNGGVRCDVVEGPCACGGWHHNTKK